MTLTMTCPRCWGSKLETNGCNGCLCCNGTGTCEDSQISQHFLLSEFLASSTAMRLGIPNDPGPLVLAQLGLLARAIETFRPAAGVLHVDSGYRSTSLNINVKGAPNSAHLYGNAVDLVPKQLTRRALFDLIRGNGLVFDQLIFEGTWIHLGLFGPSSVQRQELLIAVFGPGGTTYVPFTPDDPRAQ